ncbi:hypothetical protein [Acinetobacter nosocomialis]|uniref:hypothetical protein n=1 Tax=Acinetobacter nosocomialis TaxID=106654 RepID=UPI001ADAB2CE|nr:hypothetical protein [Acinetobacter nosocomialis]MBO8214191.1 hypothetical protein [Acinetobacter nosocomialis]
MEISTWDWGAIGSFAGAGATIYAARIALSISNQWRTQKRSEIVSEIAKKAYKQRIVYKEKIQDLYPEILKILSNKKFTEDEKKQSLQLKRLVDAMSELTITNTELISDLGIISKYYSNKHLEKTIINLNKERQALDMLIFKVLSIRTNDQELSSDEYNKLSRKIFEKTEDMKKIVDSFDLEQHLINYILHTNS